MSISTAQAAEFELIANEGSIRIAVERVRRGNVRAEAILRGWEPGRCPDPERRKERRRGLVLGAFLIPVEVEDHRARALDDTETQLPVLTRDISPHGVGFQHDRPLPGRHGVLQFDLWGDGTVELLIEQKWTRVSSGTAFRHLSGCRIVGVAKEVVAGDGTEW
jgi:hypothetical protein